MGDWIHCNNCFLRPGAAPFQFRLTSCGHIFCDNCVNNATKPKCQMCGSTNVNAILLSAKMGPEVQIFFTNIAELMKKNTQQTIQVMEFQNSHRRRYMSHLATQVNKQKELMEKAQKLYKYNQELEKELKNSKEEIAYLKRILKEQNYQQQNCVEINSNKNSPRATSTGSAAVIGPNYVNPKYGMRTTPPYLDVRQNRNTPPCGAMVYQSKIPTNQELKRKSPRDSPKVQDCFESYTQVVAKQSQGASRISPSVDSRDVYSTPPSQNRSAAESLRSFGQVKVGSVRHSPMDHFENSGHRVSLMQTSPYDVQDKLCTPPTQKKAHKSIPHPLPI